MPRVYLLVVTYCSEFVTAFRNSAGISLAAFLFFYLLIVEIISSQLGGSLQCSRDSSAVATPHAAKRLINPGKVVISDGGSTEGCL